MKKVLVVAAFMIVGISAWTLYVSAQGGRGFTGYGVGRVPPTREIVLLQAITEAEGAQIISQPITPSINNGTLKIDMLDGSVRRFHFSKLRNFGLRLGRCSPEP